MKTKTQLGDLDLEILNPIETKKIIGGNWYDYHDIPEVTIPWDGGGGSGGWDDYPGHGPGDGGGPGGDYGGGSGGSNDASAIIAGPTLPEIWWLFTKVTGQQYDKMVHNASVASQYGQNQADNVYDALRHAMWSAMDAADIGIEKAREFHTLHETEHPGPDNAMDLHNNEWGYNWYSQHGNPDNNMQQFLNDFNNAVANGQIQTQP